MNKKIRFLAGALAVGLLTAAGIHALGNLLRPVDTDSPVNAVHTFHQLPENSVEVIGYGSSHMWLGLDPRELYREYGIGAYNYGCNWQAINTTKLFVEDSLRTQKPRVVLIDTYHINELELDMDMDGEIYYTRAIPWFRAKGSYLRQALGRNPERWLSYFMPLAAFHENWVNLSRESFRSPLDSGDNFYETLGFSASDAVTPVTLPEQDRSAQQPLYDEVAEMLAELAARCRQEGIQLVFCTIPWAGQNVYSDAVAEFAAQFDCDYVNLFDHIAEMGLDEATDFSDSGHLNTSGARKTARFLGQYLKERFELTDFRQQPGNLWERAETGGF